MKFIGCGKINFIEFSIYGLAFKFIKMKEYVHAHKTANATNFVHIAKTKRLLTNSSFSAFFKTLNTKL